MMKIPERSVVVDMSPEAIDRRLRTLAELYELGMSLRTARWLGKVNDLCKPTTADAPATTKRPATIDQ